jgi:hypothetical protein
MNQARTSDISGKSSAQKTGAEAPAFGSKDEA